MKSSLKSPNHHEKTLKNHEIIIEITIFPCSKAQFLSKTGFCAGPPSPGKPASNAGVERRNVPPQQLLVSLGQLAGLFGKVYPIVNFWRKPMVSLGLFCSFFCWILDDLGWFFWDNSAHIAVQAKF